MVVDDDGRHLWVATPLSPQFACPTSDSSIGPGYGMAPQGQRVCGWGEATQEWQSARSFGMCEQSMQPYWLALSFLRSSKCIAPAPSGIVHRKMMFSPSELVYPSRNRHRRCNDLFIEHALLLSNREQALRRLRSRFG